LREATPIKKFRLGFLPGRNIHDCENEWKTIEYHDEMVWPHMFTNTLEYLPYNGGR
jgi:hypothetical protein